jgi:FtsP/CotA-like multicopper oxidase with cupredoxin domain
LSSFFPNKIILVLIFFILLFQFYKGSQNKQENFSSSKIIISHQPAFKLNIIACAPGTKNVKTYFPPHDSLEEIFTNDNRKPAGQLKNGILQIDLEARTGLWFPETHDGAGIQVYAFAEKGRPLQLPGPLIRLDQGTEIHLSVHNLIKEGPLVIHGLCARPSNGNDSIVIPFGKTYTTVFKPGTSGTYYYKASTGNIKDEAGNPFFEDSQLYGAFIVDPVNKKIDSLERIMMIGVWDDTLNRNTTGNEEFVINGLSWPYTERLTYHQDDSIRWRIINASIHSHPMHLHGFFFTVKSKGNINSDTIYQKAFSRQVVTELLKPGETMSVEWTANREGNWLFHCHTLLHIMPGSFLRQLPIMDYENMQDISAHVLNDMTGLVIGIHVLASKEKVKKEKLIHAHERHLTLVAREQTAVLGEKGFILIEHGTLSNSGEISIPGPPIILTRNESVAIKIINNLKEPTSIHWHGFEIENYYDGVPGWGSMGKKLSPLIMPGDSFIVHMTPTRAGTFIYHTHMGNAQLAEGMYGPLIVVEHGKKFDSSKEKILLVSTGGNDLNSSTILLNGSKEPEPMSLKIGKSYLLRLIDIITNSANFKVSMLYNDKPVIWRAVAKDGAELPAQQAVMYRAFKQDLTIGETRDFEFTPKQQGNYLFEILDGSGNIRVAMHINVK